MELSRAVCFFLTLRLKCDDRYDDEAGTALHVAARRENAEVLAALLEHDGAAHVNTPSAGLGGQTALHVAAASGNEEIVRLLLAAGADRQLADASGCTPSDVAERAGHDACATLLRSGE